MAAVSSQLQPSGIEWQHRALEIILAEKIIVVHTFTTRSGGSYFCTPELSKWRPTEFPHVCFTQSYLTEHRLVYAKYCLDMVTQNLSYDANSGGIRLVTTLFCKQRVCWDQGHLNVTTVRVLILAIWAVIAPWFRILTGPYLQHSDRKFTFVTGILATLVVKTTAPVRTSSFTKHIGQWWPTINAKVIWI